MKENIKSRKKLSLGIKILIGVIIGLAIGFISPGVSDFIKPIGTIFLRLLKMLIVPLVFFSITSGVTKMGDVSQLKTVGLRYVLWILLSAAVASIIGIILGLIINPGAGMQQYTESAGEIIEASQYSFINNTVSWFPENIADAMVRADMIQIIIFSLFLGVAILALGPKAGPFPEIFNAGSDIMLKITEYVMNFSPIGIAALMSQMVQTVSGAMVKEIIGFIFADYIGAAILLILLLPLVFYLFTKLNPIQFLRKISPALMVAATTTSSAATLPVSMKVSEKRLGVPERIYGFTLPLGNTMGMCGFALYIGLMCVFSSNLFGFDLTLSRIVEFIVLGIMISVGAAGVKGAGIVMSAVLFETLGMPLYLVPILAAIWPIIDIPHTILNNAGDLFGTLIVANSLKSVDMETYNSNDIEL